VSDNGKKFRPIDPRRICLSEESDVRYWTEQFGVSRERLRLAVEAVGPDPKMVESRLTGRRIHVAEKSAADESLDRALERVRRAQEDLLLRHKVARTTSAGRRAWHLAVAEELIAHSEFIDLVRRSPAV
jgi:hypothetical protein